MKLSLPEQLVLVSLDDRTGHAVPSMGNSLHYGIAGAVVFELLKRDLLEKTDDHLMIRHGARTGDEVLDMAIEMIEHLKKPRPMGYLIQQISGKAEKMKSILLDRLVEQRILDREEHRLLWVIHYDLYPTHNVAPENRIRKRMIGVVEGKVEMKESDCILLSLIHACELDKEIFPEDFLAEAKERIRAIIKDEEIGHAVSEIAQQLQVAVSIAISTAAIPTIL